MALFRMRVVNSKGFVSEAINLATDSLWDHAEVQDDDGGWIAAHAGTGVSKLAENYMVPSRERRYSIPCTDEQHDKAMAFARSKIGTPYDYGDIVGLLLHDRAINQEGRVICSMFVFEAAWAGGIYMLNVLPNYTNLVTPETLHLSNLLIGNCTYDSMEGK